MVQKLSDSLTPNEKLLRSVPAGDKAPNLWKKSGEVSYTAFMDDKGVSVEVEMGRENKMVIKNMRKRLCCDYVFSFLVSDCRKIKIFINPETEKNPYHYSLYKNKKLKAVTMKQAKYIRDKAKGYYNKNKYPPYTLSYNL